MRLSQSRRSFTSKSAALETVILFRAGAVIFAIAADAVEEIRDLTGLQKLSVPAEHQKFTRVTHTLDREGKRHFVIDICAHFGVQPGRASRLMVLRHAPAAVMVDAIERMQEIDSIQALPAAFRGEERNWYRGLIVVKGRVIPVVRPEAFLTKAEAVLLQATLRGSEAGRSAAVTA